MKHFFRKLTALSAAAITAVSMMTATGFGASAYSVGNDNINYLTLGKGCNGKYWHTKQQQEAYPLITLKLMQSNLLQNGKLTCTIHETGFYGDPTGIDIFGIVDESIIRNGYVSNARQYLDKLYVQSDRNHKYGVALIHENHAQGVRNFALRMYPENTAYYTIGSNLIKYMELSDYSYNANTGVYSGNFILEENYILGMKLSCSDGMTKFDDPVLMYDDEWDDLYTVIHFSGKVKYPDQGKILFNTGVTNGSYSILNNLKITYNSGSYTTNNFVKTISKSEMNNNYQGMLDGNTLNTKISGTNKTNFNKSNFLCAKASGNTLYLYVGQNVNVPDNRWRTATGAVKLDAFLNSTGWKTALPHNTWIVNWLNSHNNVNCTVRFMCNSTKNYTGNEFHHCTASEFRNNILGIW